MESVLAEEVIRGSGSDVADVGEGVDRIFLIVRRVVGIDLENIEARSVHPGQHRPSGIRGAAADHRENGRIVAQRVDRNDLRGSGRGAVVVLGGGGCVLGSVLESREGSLGIILGGECQDRRLNRIVGGGDFIEVLIDVFADEFFGLQGRNQIFVHILFFRHSLRFQHGLELIAVHRLVEIERALGIFLHLIGDLDLEISDHLVGIGGDFAGTAGKKHRLIEFAFGYGDCSDRHDRFTASGKLCLGILACRKKQGRGSDQNGFLHGIHLIRPPYTASVWSRARDR